MNIGKKLISLLTVFCLTLSLVPTVALAAGTASVKLRYNSSLEFEMVNGDNTTYYTGSSVTTTQPTSWKAKYEPTTNTLTLNNYVGGPVIANGNLTILLDSTNNITSVNNGINITGNLTIEGTGSLELTGARNTTIYASGDITIQGGAKVKATGGQDGQAIHAVGGTLTITGSGTKVEATHGFEGAIKTGNNNGTINLNDGAQLIAPRIDDIKGNLKINGADATPEQKGQISNTNGITAAPSAPTYTVSGMVKDSGGQAIVGATVQLCTADNVNANALTLIKESNTDSSGEYKFSGISAGTYTIKVSKTGYNTATKENVTVNDSTPNVSVQTIALSPEIQTYAVTITGTEHMSLSSGSGALIQTVNQGSRIQNVVLEAAEGYYFPTNYTEATVDGFTVKRDSYAKITISGTPTANTTINLTSPTEKGTQAALSFSDFSAYDCTNSNNNDGCINVNTSGVGNSNTKIEYQKKNDTAASNWEQIDLQGASAKIQKLTPGTYLVRYPATDTQNASTSWEVTIFAYTPYGLWVRGIPVTNENKSNILGDGAVSYNPDTKTLTLNNAIINNTTSPTVALTTPRSYVELASIATTDELKIEVTGDSTISSTNGNAIHGKNSTDMAKNLTITGNASLALKSYGTMSAISLDRDKLHNLAINGNVTINATVDPKNPDSITSDDNGLVFSATNIELADNATVSTINNGKSLAIYCPGELIVKDSATLTAQSSINDHAISVKDFNYPNHSVTASKNFSGTPMVHFEESQLDTYMYVKVAPTRVTGVTLNQTSLTMKTNQTATLTATVNPSDDAVQDVNWTSSDTNVATINTRGTTCEVTAVGVGTATITVTTADGSHTASCTVTVTRASSSGGSHTTYYPVNTPAKSEGGSVVVSQKSASKGSAVTVTVTPESGYQVSSVQAVDKDGKKLTLTDKGDGKYTFVMPGSKVEVFASFAQVQKPEETSPYRDVSKDSYYYDAVQWASNKGITNGVADSVFAPDWVCTRGQIVTFLWRSVGSPAPKTAKMPFADVAEDAYYAQAVLWAVENGITKGTSETTFSPDQTCTRAHAVAFLYRLVGSPAVTGSSFQDVAADAYYNAAVAWAVQQGITNGTSETTFSPDETCTRAQIVTFLYRMDQAK